jgi:hypothetical protein
MYEDDVRRYYAAANAMMTRLERMPPPVRDRLERIHIRCPVKGCLLATVYWMSRRPTAEELEHHRRLAALRDPDGNLLHSRECRAGDYFYVGRTPSGAKVYDLLGFASALTWKDEARGCTCCRILYWRSGCRHGTASIDREAIYGMFSVANRILGPLQTEERAVAGLPDHLRAFWGKRVFHPAPAAWHPKKQQPRSGSLVPVNPRTRTRAAEGV